jgi:hypothetical protein
LIALGIGGLVWSHALAPGWWQGTLQALGVGLIVGGLVDVLAVTGLDRYVKAEELRFAHAWGRDPEAKNAAMVAEAVLARLKQEREQESRQEQDRNSGGEDMRRRGQIRWLGAMLRRSGSRQKLPAAALAGGSWRQDATGGLILALQQRSILPLAARH